MIAGNQEPPFLGGDPQVLVVTSPLEAKIVGGDCSMSKRVQFGCKRNWHVFIEVKVGHTRLRSLE